MSAEDPKLRAALGQLAAADAAELLSEARAQARARVREILTNALVDSMLDGVRRVLDPEPPPAPRERNEPARRERNEPAPPPPPRAATSELGWYVYGVVAAEAAAEWTASGIDPAHAVATVREGDVAAVVSRVPLEEFGEVRLREHLGDMSWVEATARAHEGVLEQTRAQATVIPMRMCTVYRIEDGVREMLRREAITLRQALEHLEGRTEMGVKVFADPERVQPEAEPAAEGSGAGAAYMEHRRRERDRAETAAQRLEEAAVQIHERLLACAVDGRPTPPQRPEASGHRGEMILNGVYLVTDDALESFRREVAGLHDEFRPTGLELELTGPWPAYNFVPDTIGAAW